MQRTTRSGAGRGGRRYLPLLIAGNGLLLLGCGQPGPTVPSTAADPPLASRQELPPGVIGVEGVVGPGALYGLYRPAVGWNGTLVLYAHGYVNPGSPLVLPTVSPVIETLRDALLAMGFGVAMSSFSETGFALQDGAQRTHQLRGLFEEQLGSPVQTVLMGHSLGGMIALMLAERHPDVYAGAMLVCTFPGGSKRQLEYVADVRAVFDALFPGVLSGDVFDVPEGLDFTGHVVPAVVAAMTDPANAASVATFASVDRIHMPSDPTNLVLATLAALRYQILGTGDVLARTHSRIPIDNAGVDYTIGGLSSAALNAAIQRFSSTADARNYLRRNYEPTGRLSIPVLMLHTTEDPDTPYFHQALYANTADAGGGSELLVQRAFERFGHCAVDEAEHAQALAELMTWIATGIRPAP